MRSVPITPGWRHPSAAPCPAVIHRSALPRKHKMATLQLAHAPAWEPACPLASRSFSVLVSPLLLNIRDEAGIFVGGPWAPSPTLELLLALWVLLEHAEVAIVRETDADLVRWS